VVAVLLCQVPPQLECCRGHLLIGSLADQPRSIGHLLSLGRPIDPLGGARMLRSSRYILHTLHHVTPDLIAQFVLHGRFGLTRSAPDAPARGAGKSADTARSPPGPARAHAAARRPSVDGRLPTSSGSGTARAWDPSGSDSAACHSHGTLPAGFPAARLVGHIDGNLLILAPRKPSPLAGGSDSQTMTLDVYPSRCLPFLAGDPVAASSPSRSPPHWSAPSGTYSLHDPRYPGPKRPESPQRSLPCSTRLPKIVHVLVAGRFSCALRLWVAAGSRQRPDQSSARSSKIVEVFLLGVEGRHSPLRQARGSGGIQ
jgi:hypothetical protein